MTESRQGSQRRRGRWLWLSLLSLGILTVLAVALAGGPRINRAVGDIVPGGRLSVLSEADKTESPSEAPQTGAPLGFACDPKACWPTDPPAAVAAGRFDHGEADLTGDGVPEQVRIEQQQIVILNDEQEVWRSPETWQVDDLALGDPNDDGRQEMMVALWKADDSGVLQSHPFIAGYRSGSYRTVWGGSAVADPVHELELGDVDGDGVEELVVLESAGKDKVAVSVWDWHGWGFSMAWRSEPGIYRDLYLFTPEGEREMRIGVLAEPGS